MLRLRAESRPSPGPSRVASLGAWSLLARAHGELASRDEREGCLKSRSCRGTWPAIDADGGGGAR